MVYFIEPIIKDIWLLEVIVCCSEWDLGYWLSEWPKVDARTLVRP
jgi:hypothetical protein